MKKLFYLLALLVTFSFTSCSEEEIITTTDNITLPVIEDIENIYILDVESNVTPADGEGNHFTTTFIYPDGSTQENYLFPNTSITLPDNISKVEVIISVTKPGFRFRIYHNGNVIEDVNKPNGFSYLKIYTIN